MTIPTNTLTPEDLKREWRTPSYIFDPLNLVFHFSLDVAATRHNATCLRWIDEEINALSETLWGVVYREKESGLHHRNAVLINYKERCWLNPPHSRRDSVVDWVEACYHQAKDNDYLVVALLPASVGSNWANKWVLGHATVYLIEGRVNYDPPIGYEQLEGEKLSGPTFDSMIAIWWPGLRMRGGISQWKPIRKTS
jgi:phage N-6-adenine-methyltransferase